MASPYSLTPEQQAAIKALSMSKRAAVVRDYIFEHGSITTDEIRALGYNHPPRAARDLKDAGADVASMSVTNSSGARMASYSFLGEVRSDGGNRRNIPKKFADAIKKNNEHKCAICSGKFSDRELQIDHRLPFAIAGDSTELTGEEYMPLCAPHNRAKSWECENCPNWRIRNPDTCKGCFWANPENYTHVATKPERRAELSFQGPEVLQYEDVKKKAELNGTSIEEVIKTALLSYLQD